MIADRQTKRASVRALGCRLNQYEVTAIADRLAVAGYQVVPFGEPADLGVINTCTVTNEADAKSRNVIRRFIRTNPHAVTVVVGCYSQVGASSVAEIQGVDYVIGNQDKMNLLEYIGEEKTDRPVVVRDRIDREDFSLSINGDTPFEWRANLKVQDGCDYTCSFCTIPFARGKSRSDTIANTMKVAREVAQTDAREIVLTGVNIGDFGKGTTETFFDLIQELDQLEGIDRIRISSIEPNLLTDEMIEFCAASQKFMPHFHVPLQSGSDKILGAMRRRYKRTLYENCVAKIKQCIPDACIGVDVIVGFPGETDDDFLDTYNFLNELDISYLHVFTYSERPNTDALEIGAVVSKGDRAYRSKMLHILSDKKRRFFHEQFIGQERPVLFESVKNGKIMGHTDNYIQVQVNGEIDLINTINNILLSENNDMIVNGILA